MRIWVKMIKFAAKFMVNAKILSIDKDNCKIGLTIKELEGTSQEYGYEDYIKSK